MFKKLNIQINSKIISEAVTDLPDINFRMSINTPTDNFFYDPWTIKEEFKNSAWNKLLKTLPFDTGEARIIKLDPCKCYIGHSDIDDRWHTTLAAKDSFLINLNTCQMFELTKDFQWYELDTSIRHSAVNFSNVPRIQLVVRKLLVRGNIPNPINVKLTLKKIVEDRRYIFDDLVSPWLNNQNKKGLLNNFSGEEFKATFTTDSSVIDSLNEQVESYFNLEIVQ